MIDYDILTKASDAVWDAEWTFRLEVVNAINEIAEERGSNILTFDFTMDDPRNMEGNTMTLTKVEICGGGDSVEFTTNEDVVYYIYDFFSDEVINIVKHIEKEGKPYKEGEE